jgi:hypothetical protein
MAEFRVFLSAVTSEFGSARDTLAASLRSRDLLLRVQCDLRQEAAADATDATALAGDPGFLALAPERAGDYIAAAPLPMSPADYRTLLRDSFAEVMKWSDPPVKYYPCAVAATRVTSVARLDDVLLVNIRKGNRRHWVDGRSPAYTLLTNRRGMM